MKKTDDGANTPAPENDHATSKKRKRRRQYTEQIYGARPLYEDARIIDEYASRNGLERAEVVRKALHMFALRQGMKYPSKDALQEMQEKVFREYFAELFERMEAISIALRDLPQEVGVRDTKHPLRPTGHAPETGCAPSDGGEIGAGFATPLESLVRAQNSVLEQTLMTATFVLRLLVNYHVDPQLRRLDPLNPKSIEPYLLAADQGTASWSAQTAEVMWRTGEKIKSEMDPNNKKSKPGTPGAPQVGAEIRATAVTDAEISAAL